MELLDSADSIRFMRRFYVKIRHTAAINIHDPDNTILTLEIPEAGFRYQTIHLRAIDIGLAICTNGAIQIHCARYGMFSLEIIRNGTVWLDFSGTNFQDGPLMRNYRLGCGCRILYEQERAAANLSETDEAYYHEMQMRMRKLPTYRTPEELTAPLFTDFEIRKWEERIYADGKDHPNFN